MAGANVLKRSAHSCKLPVIKFLMAMDHQAQLTRIRTKMSALASLDKGNTLFGASKHHHHIHAPKKEPELAFFEQQHGIQLPSGYRQYLLTIGNGGMGPYYGLERFEASRNLDLDAPQAGAFTDPSQPFTFTEAWNMAPETDPERQAEADKDYHDPKWVHGLLRVANYGCGISINLVVNGPEYGKIWVDDRVNRGGIYPDHLLQNPQRLEFLDWVELWADQSLAELSGREGQEGMLGGRAPFA